MDEGGRDSLELTTERGTLYAKEAGDGLTSINMGQPLLNWHEIPLNEDVDTLRLPIDGEPTAT